MKKVERSFSPALHGVDSGYLLLQRSFLASIPLASGLSNSLSRRSAWCTAGYFPASLVFRHEMTAAPSSRGAHDVAKKHLQTWPGSRGSPSALSSQLRTTAFIFLDSLHAPAFASPLSMPSAWAWGPRTHTQQRVCAFIWTLLASG